MPARAALPVLLAFAGLFPTIGPATAQDLPAERNQIPMIGLDGPQMDACGGIGAITHYELDLPVRERPDNYAREKDRLPIRTLVWLCEAVGDYQGVVYASGEFQKLGDCKVSSPVAEPKPYAGPCAFGWVTARNLSLVAG